MRLDRELWREALALRDEGSRDDFSLWDIWHTSVFDAQ
jgi:hypothetical protein